MVDLRAPVASLQFKTDLDLTFTFDETCRCRSLVNRLIQVYLMYSVP